MEWKFLSGMFIILSALNPLPKMQVLFSTKNTGKESKTSKKKRIWNPHSKKGVFSMKVKENYVLTRVVDSFVLVPVGTGNVDLNTIISLNETGAFIWERLKEDTTKEALVDALTKEYEISRDKAEKDIDTFIAQMTEAGLIE